MGLIKPPSSLCKERMADDLSHSLSDPATPMSQQSASMDESSDSEADSPSARDSESRYPVEGLFVSHAEKADIMSMREVEREVILAERREENERLRQNRMLRQLVINQDNEESKRKNKRKAGAADLDADDGKKKTSRPRTKADLTSPRFETLRKAREDRSNRAQQRLAERDRRKGRSPSYEPAIDADADNESDIEWAAPSKRKSMSRTPETREVLPADLRDIERVRVGRSRFGEVCFYPGFDAAIAGCYVRISIGPDPTTHEPVYRLAVIKGFTTGKPYAVANARGKQFVTDQYVRAAHGKSVREWPFIMCSDSAITEAEWERYKKTLTVEGLSLPTKQTLVKKIDDINKLVQRSWTDIEIADKLARQNALKVKYGGFEKERIERDIRRAIEENDAARLTKLQEELDHLETPRLAFKTSLTPTKKKDSSYGNGAASGNGASDSAQPLSQQDRLALLNAENRRRNAEDVRKAQLKERARQRALEAKLERGEAVNEDHSRRVKTKAKFMYDVNQSDTKKKDRASGLLAVPGQDTAAGSSKEGTPAPGSGLSTPAGGTPRIGPTLKPLGGHLAKLQQARNAEVRSGKGGVPSISKPLTDDDFIGALELDIDVEID
jgi:RNA polymerase-associated protein RTF1